MDEPFETELAALLPAGPDPALGRRIALERELTSLHPLPPSDLLRERIAAPLAVAPARGADGVDELRPRGRALAAVAAAGLLLLGGLALLRELSPAELPEDPLPAAIAAAPIAAVLAPKPYLPISARRTVLAATDGGVQEINGEPMRVLLLKTLDEIEYEQFGGRRVVVRQPGEHVSYRQLASY